MVLRWVEQEEVLWAHRDKFCVSTMIGHWEQHSKKYFCLINKVDANEEFESTIKYNKHSIIRASFVSNFCIISCVDFTVWFKTSCELMFFVKTVMLLISVVIPVFLHFRNLAHRS